MFQRQVNLQPAPAVAGDFASANPRASFLAGAGGLVAGAEGVTVGRFGWVASDGKTVHNYGTYPAAPGGFIHREQQALITQFLAETSNMIPAGIAMAMQISGDYWVKNLGPSAVVGDGTESVYANFSDGNAYTAAPTGASVTGSIGATAATGSMGATFTASADTDDTKLVVTSVTGLISVGETVSGTGVTVGTKITGQVSGTPGGAGTYQLDQSNTASSATVTSFGTTLKLTAVTGSVNVGDAITAGTGIPAAARIASLGTSTGGTGTVVLDTAASAYAASTADIATSSSVLKVTAVGSGVLAVGDEIAGASVTSGSQISALGTGTGGTGTYALTKASTAASTTVTVTAGIVTGWKFKSAAAVGELAKISTY